MGPPLAPPLPTGGHKGPYPTPPPSRPYALPVPLITDLRWFMLCSSKTALTHNFLNGSDNALWTGYVELFKWWAEGNRRMGSCDQLNGCIKFGEGFVRDQCGYICSRT